MQAYLEPYVEKAKPVVEPYYAKTVELLVPAPAPVPAQ